MTIEIPPEGRYLLDFDTSRLPRVTTDILVIGGGVAGLSAALAAGGEARVLMVAKDDLCNTAWAQGGIAAAVGPEDSPAEHARDTIRAGCGLSDEAMVATVTEAAPAAIDLLVARGARFDRDDGGFALGREGGHHRRRVVHQGDATGREIMRALHGAVARAPAVQLDSRLFIVDLLTVGERCVGALALSRDGRTTAIFARAVILAAGGASRLWRESSNVRGATGDGIAAAFRAGAALRDLEFVQFHPTTLYLAGSDRVLVTEAVRGEGAYVIDNRGERFLEKVHPLAELAPRDVVSRAIVERLAEPGVTGVFLDLRHWPRERAAQRFPGLAQTCARYGLDPTTDPIPVRPAAHYFIGGVACDVDGATSLEGLFSCGEAACSGLHGANRLASNSLLEGLVLGTGAGRAAVRLEGGRHEPSIRHATRRCEPERDVDIVDLRKSLASRMWRSVSVVRDAPGLAEAADSIRLWRYFTARIVMERRVALELENLLLVGGLVTAAASLREESRGTHVRSDHAERDDRRFSGSFHWRAGRPPEFCAKEAKRG